MINSTIGWRPDAVTASVQALQQLDNLSRLPYEELRLIAPLCVLRAFEPGEVIVAERSIARVLFVLTHGSVTVSRDDTGGNKVLLSLLGRGDVFGEGGLFGSRFRRITARAETRVYLLQIAYDELNRLLPSLPRFAAQLRLAYRERLLQTTLASVPLFAGLTAIERMGLATDLDDRHIERGATIMHSGTDAEALHIIADGQAVVVRDGRRMAVLNPGDFFGEMELLGLAVPEADVVALTPVHILSLPQMTFTQLLQEHPPLGVGMRDIARARLQAGMSAVQIVATEAAIDAGVVRGPKVLARVPSLCPPGCNLCERGCAERFGATRIHLNGTGFGSFDVPVGCRHCSSSPECVEACPEDAIRFGEDGFLHVTDRCTGCTACADACPYHAIDMIPLYPTARDPLNWVLHRVKRPPPLRLHANKCDGCHGYSDQACISICPTGSLRWVSVDELLDEKLVAVGRAETSLAAN
ncbi:MAG: transcriptional regulator, Crp/Fnr family [uncultured Chloroflexia bacterium]|uniref:Transcriptional regulator, Crp/Fnr family n=1 Tax=uncultured Chloroflexia bacterium TaxID=1672391 RepID=A0A6J4ICT7_9CHLR|nr:MAG: transcriptional regulator, Crp/Fnr family [uncultured Chloroflexia bacterium]